jgi:drug/metabolite transporter (DMT)-like permease
MTTFTRLGHSGVLAALGAALLFGAGTPLAKWLLGKVDPWMLAGLFYLGSGLGLWLYRWLRQSGPVTLAANEWPWLAGAIVSGGVVGPLLLMFGLTHMPASTASLLLNAESVFTALIAWVVFKENVDRRIALGMAAIVLGALLLSWPERADPADPADLAGMVPTLAVLGACLAWGLDNNLTRRVSLSDATWIASVKGLVAGSVNLALALSLGAKLPSLPFVVGAAMVGFCAYGVSLALFVVGLRYLGTARTGAYFSVAPFFGAALAVPLLGEPLSVKLMLAGLAMGVGVWLHLTERHQHFHSHEAMEHTHEHVHDEHHQHLHPDGAATREPHSHTHRHEAMPHSHAHFPDAHHRHDH